MSDPTTIFLDIRRSSAIYYLLSGVIGAYNRRTDALLRASATDPAEIALLTERLKRSHDQLQAAEDAAMTTKEMK